MNKQDAIQRVKELEEYILNCDKPKKNKLKVVDVSSQVSMVMINGVRAITLMREEMRGTTQLGCEVSGHGSSAFLSDFNGVWYDERGEEISGYIYFKEN
jgi:hypothetical protein